MEQLNFLGEIEQKASTLPLVSDQTSPPLPSLVPQFPSLEEAAACAAVCTACRLHMGRTKSVFSDGNPASPVMLIGEGPGQNEDETGIPFVGKAGQLLTQILASVKIDRKQDIYICNIVKCRPPENRAPFPDEMETCSRFLHSQIALIRPQIILLAGATALKGLLKNPTPISKIRGQWLSTSFYGAKAMPLFHPSYLLRNQSKEPGSPKWLMWQDIQEVRRVLDQVLQGISIEQAIQKQTFSNT